MRCADDLSSRERSMTKPTLWILVIGGVLFSPAPRLVAAEPPAARLLAPERGQFPNIFGPRRGDAPKQPAAPRHYADVPFEGNLEMSLKARLEQIRDLRQLLEELQKHPELFDPDKMPKGFDPKDPKFLEKVPKLLEMFKGMGLVEGEGDGIKLNAEKLKYVMPDLGKKLEQAEAGPGEKHDKNPFVPDFGGMPPLDPNGQPVPFPQGGAPPMPEVGDLEEQSRLAEFFKDWMLRMEDSKFGDLFRNSPAFQEGIKDLTQEFQKGDAPLWKPGAGFADGLTKWGNPGNLSWFKNAWSNFNNLSLTGVRPPHLKGPRIGGWAANMPTPVPGGWGAPGAGGGVSFGMVFVWVGVGVVVLILLWKFLPQLKLGGRVAANQGWQLGPWPVDPNRVSTRADVVKAFEFLSLLRFGLDVRTWNHRDIASALGTEVGQRQAAEELAGVYELARYTPDDERLPEASLAAARRDLCFLAGMS
jgi:hypothetical protein